MKHFLAVLVSSLILTASGAAQAPAKYGTTLAAIPLDAQWKEEIYSFARRELKHPAWGWTHSERDYLLALELAAGEHWAVDKDVLFAAAFTHDIGAIGDFQKDGVDHAVRSVEIAEPLLREAGFPSEKL